MRTLLVTAVLLVVSVPAARADTCVPAPQRPCVRGDQCEPVAGETCQVVDRDRASRRCCRTRPVTRRERHYVARKKRWETRTRMVHERQCETRMVACQRTTTCRIEDGALRCARGAARCDAPIGC